MKYPGVNETGPILQDPMTSWFKQTGRMLSCIEKSKLLFEA